MQRVRDLSREMQALYACCPGCLHSVALVLDDLPPDLPLTCVAPKLRCSKCGCRRCEIRIVWHRGYVPRFQHQMRGGASTARS